MQQLRRSSLKRWQRLSFLQQGAANRHLRSVLTGLCADRDVPFAAPPLALCTDNAAMIAWAGAERYAAGMVDDLSVPARPRWPLDPAAEKARGAGVKA